MFGEIFKDILLPYEFWGYGDIDVIYGDLKKYLTKKILDENDIITFREYIVSGAFTILRKNEYTINLYKVSPDIDRVLSTESYMGFDEAGNKIGECRKLIPAYELTYIDNFICWTSIVQKESDNGNLKLYSRYFLKESILFCTKLVYNNGEIHIKSDPDEFAIFHLVREKRNPSFVIPKWKKIEDEFYITTTGFYNHKEYHNWYFLLSNVRKLSGFIKKIKKRANDSFNYRFLNKQEIPKNYKFPDYKKLES